MAFPVKNRLALAKVESTVGTDSTPVVGTNAVRSSQASPGLTLEVLAIESETGALDNNEQAANGGFMAPNIQVVLRGSGTAGTAPDFDALFQSCAMGVTTLAAAVTGTATAGGASTITLEDGDIAADDQYIGMIIELTAGTGYSASDPKQNRRVITDTVASTDVCTVFPAWAVEPDNTTEYAIRACNRYAPISTAIKSSSIYILERGDASENARRFKALGCRGTFSVNLPTRGPGTITFDLRGALQEPDDVSDPGDPTLLTSRPISWIDAQTYLGSGAVCMGAFTLDMGGQVVVTQCQNEVYGYQDAAINSRRIAGTINPRAVNFATRNVFDAWAAQSTAQFWTAFGPAAGNRVSIYIPQLIYGGTSAQEIDGFIHDQIPFLCGGNNNNVYITFF